MNWLILLLLLSFSVFALELPPGVQKIVDYQNDLAVSITFLIAFLGGLLTFISPCGFVLLPAFLAYVFKEKKKAFVMTVFFSLGLLLAFVIFGIIAGIVGSFFSVYKEFFAVIAGFFLILFGALLVFNNGFSFFKFSRKKPLTGFDIFLLGFFFAVGWTPCVGPILGGVGLLAAMSGSILKSSLLFGVYAVGVILPLLLVAYFSDKTNISSYFTSKPVEFLLFGRRIMTNRYNIVGGVILAVIGIIMVFDKGTGVFMKQIPRYVPWRMEFFTSANEWLVASDFFTSQAANIVGALAAFVTLFFVFRYLRKTYKQDR